MFSPFKVKLCEKNCFFYDNDYNNRASNSISLTGDSQIAIFPSISPDAGTPETPGADSETTQPNTQTPDQTHSNPPEKHSVTSKVGTTDIVPHYLCQNIKKIIFSKG